MTSMARLLGLNSHLISYGAMSKQPLSLPTSLFIFKNLTAHGFWQSRWYKDNPQSEQEALIHKLVQLMLENKVTNSIQFCKSLIYVAQLAPPSHEIITISARESRERAIQNVRSIFSKLSKGYHGKKVLLRLEHLT